MLGYAGDLLHMPAYLKIRRPFSSQEDVHDSAVHFLLAFQPGVIWVGFRKKVECVSCRERPITSEANLLCFGRPGLQMQRKLLVANRSPALVQIFCKGGPFRFSRVLIHLLDLTCVLTDWTAV